MTRDNNTPDGESLGGGAGAASLAGYEYQIDVSVWLALDLVLAQKLTQELILEPASQEDIEAEMSDDVPGRVTSNASLEGYKLVVQAKLRTGDAWSVNGIKALLEHGVTRDSACNQLADPRVRYLLVTSATLNGETRGLKVHRVNNWPNPSDMPISIVNILPPDAAGRVAIVGNQDAEHLFFQIKQLLTDSFRVPNSRLEECRLALREEARLRIAGADNGRWHRDELEDKIRQFDGYIASSLELENYVHPTNWSELRQAMQERYAALIVGQSGTGKTMATKKLYEELRTSIPGLTRVPITMGPHQLEADRTPPPVLYDIEDPWGRFSFDPNSRPWNDKLSRYFSSARHDRLIVATSRLDVAQSTNALKSVNKWIVGLEAEHYGTVERRRLYRTRIDALPRKLQVLAVENEDRVLSELATPLELQKFFDALSTNASGVGNLIKDAISQAHQESIEQTVLNQIQERNDTRAAAVIWGLLKATGKFSFNVLGKIEEALFNRDPEHKKGVSPLVHFFVAARNLRQLDSIITYYHPRVEAGIESALSDDRLVAKQTLEQLIDVLQAGNGLGGEWGVSTSVVLLAAATKMSEFRPQPSIEAQNKIDDWLVNELVIGGNGFGDNLRLAKLAGSSTSNVSEVARFLLYRPENTCAGALFWEAPKHDESWYAKMRTDVNVKQVVDLFIRKSLPNESADFGSSFVSEIRRLAEGLTPAFLEAASVAVHYGYISTGDAIAEGALDDIDGYELIVDMAVEILTPTESSIREQQELSLAITNEEFSEDYAEHLSNNDDGYTAGIFLKAYVAKVRATGSWKKLLNHRHLERIYYYWVSALQGDSKSNAEELADAFSVGYGTGDEDSLWGAVERRWDIRFKDSLVKRVLDGHSNLNCRLSALLCVVTKEPNEIQSIARTLISRNQESRLAEIAVDLGILRNRGSKFVDDELHAGLVKMAGDSLPKLYAEIGEASFSLEERNIPALSNEALSFLHKITGNFEQFKVFRVKIDETFPIDVAEDIRWLLKNTDNANNAVAAIKSAIRHGITDVIESALEHKFSDVVARSLIAVATPINAPLPERLLNFSSAKGYSIREALLTLLDGKPHSDHLGALLRLVKDHWSKHSSYYGEAQHFPIARAAIPVIAKSGLLSEENLEELFLVAINSQDPILQYEIFRLICRVSSIKFQERLFELATKPGRQTFRCNVAHALLAENAFVQSVIVDKITPELLGEQAEDVSARLFLLLIFTADEIKVIETAAALATDFKRRVLLLLAIWIMHDHNLSVAGKIVAMLPTGHIAVKLILSGEIPQAWDALLDDLGNTQSVNVVKHFVRTKKD